LQKLASLIRLALSAGVQKRDFLRMHAKQGTAPMSGFLLDRARLVVQPVGLDLAVGTLIGQYPAESAEGLEFARRIIERLRDVVREDGRSRHLEVGIDATWLDKREERETDPSIGRLPADLEDQLRVAAEFHQSTFLGTTTLRWDADALTLPEKIVASLHWLWKRTEVGRVRFMDRRQLSRQLTISG
jgi:hypothetical protein